MRFPVWKEKTIQPCKENIMNAEARVRVTGNNTVVDHTHRVLPGRRIEVTKLNAMNDAKIHEAPATRLTMLKTIGMAFAAPLIGLAYALSLPVVGICLLVKLALEDYANRTPATAVKMRTTLVVARNIGLFLVAPFIALGYVIALPVVGCFMIARLARDARARRVCADS